MGQNSFRNELFVIVLFQQSSRSYSRSETDSYVDDLAAFCTGLDSHLLHARLFLSAMRDSGLTLKLDKKLS